MLARAQPLPLAEGVRGLRLDQAKRLKEFEEESTRLKTLVADQTLDEASLIYYGSSAVLSASFEDVQFVPEPFTGLLLAAGFFG